MKGLRSLYQGSDTPEQGIKRVAEGLYTLETSEEAQNNPFDFPLAVIETMDIA